MRLRVSAAVERINGDAHLSTAIDRAGARADPLTHGSGSARMRALHRERPFMQIRILRHECCGHAECVEIAPDVFALDTRNKASVLDPNAAPPERLVEAAEACPCQAIEVLDDEGDPYP